jgi:hypothetical protein
MISEVNGKLVFNLRQNIAGSCGEDTALAEAHQSAERFQGEHLTLTAAVERDTFCGDDQGVVWAPLDQVQDGERSFKSLLGDAKTGIVFGNERKYQVVEALPEIAGEQHLALCEVSGQLGPPRNCKTVAILTKDEVLIRAMRPLDMCFFAGHLRVSGSIEIHYVVTGAPALSEIAFGLANELTSKQKLKPEVRLFKDNAGTVRSVRLRSSTPLRDSSVLSAGWRESYDFDVDLNYDRAGIDNIVDIEGDLRPLVSRQAVGNLTEYQGLDDAQRGIYLNYFDSLVGEAIKKICDHPKYLDATNIICH